MKAIAADEYGSPASVLKLVDRPDPKVGPDSVLIKVRAAGVNPVDWKVLAGYLDPMMDVAWPLIPGWDVAGTVVGLGADTPEFAVGDEVIGYVRRDEVGRGTFAELVAAPVRTLAPKPRTLSWAQAAGLPLVGLTALQSIRRVGVTAGQTALVHAAAGGVGSVAVQLLRHFGLRVIGTASERNHDYLRSLGAEPIRYGDGLVDRIRELAPDGVDVAFDFVGGGILATTDGVLTNRTRAVSIADPAVKETGGHYVWARPVAADLAELAELAAAGQLTVNVEAELPLERAAEALQQNMSGRTRGKIVVTVD